HIASRHRSLGIVTEDNEYPELIRRTFNRLNSAAPAGLTLVEENFKTAETDLRQTLLRLKTRKVEALFLNPNAEPSFIRLVQQLEQIRYKPALYTVFWP